MAQVQTASDRLAALKAEIKQLEQAALSELIEKRNSLSQQLAQVDAEIAELTGVKGEVKKRTRRSASGESPARSLPLQELKELLAAAPDKTVSIRKENLELQNIKTLANANPHLLRMGGKGPWPTVTLLK
jgi:DNA repair exonuclease SbcCD ATPase subunit